MILRTNDTEKFNLSMRLCVDDELEEITVYITFWNKKTGVTTGFEYPANEYRTALAKYRELENLYAQEVHHEKKTEK